MMALEQSQQNEIKQEVLKNAGATTTKFSNTNYKTAQDKTEKNHIISEKEADDDLNKFLEEKFKDDMKVVWTESTAYMANGDFQKALDVLYPVIEKNKDFLFEQFNVDINIWGNAGELYADTYNLNLSDHNGGESKSIKDYETQTAKMYQEIKNQEGENKGKNLGTASLTMYLLIMNDRNVKLKKILFGDK
ncbi:MAG: hypothetical protein NT085_03515 [candidate division SR1 bacterium]|nr:hypothetical protein [candidate division SR1 bacterium]